MFVFKKGIGQNFIDRLNAEYERGGWWRAMASDPNLFIAIRDGSLNVYSNGNSLLRLWLDGERLIGEVHYKFLLTPTQVKPYVRVEDGKVLLPDPAAAFFQPDLTNLSALKQAAAPYAGGEKAGVHSIALSNPNILDVEIAFGGSANEGETSSANRIDFAALRPTAEGAEVVFYEAKQFANKELRAKGEALPPVLQQIEGYRNLLDRHRAEVERSYRVVCGTLAALEGVRDRYGALLPLMRQIATNDAPLTVNRDVRLVVFGFDSDQRNGPAWTPHRKKLEGLLPGRLLLKGDAEDFTKGISTP